MSPSKQREAEARAERPTPMTEPIDRVRSRRRPPAEARHRRPQAKTRFYGVKTLNPDKIALDFKNIADEVIAHLRADDGTELVVRIEIEATDTNGFDESKVRTVSENARTLKFDQSGFEES